MNTIRKRAIVNSMKKHATQLVCQHGQIENARIVLGRGIVSKKEELAILDSMHHYGEILWRIYPDFNYKQYPFNLWWTEELINMV